MGVLLTKIIKPKEIYGTKTTLIHISAIILNNSIIPYHRNHGWTSFSANAEAYNQTFLRSTSDMFLEGICMYMQSIYTYVYLKLEYVHYVV